MSELLEKTINSISPLDREAMAQAQERQNCLTKPQGSLGQLEGLSIKLAGIQRRALPEISHKAIVTMAGDHGVAAEGVSAFPPSVTPQMVANFLCGGAAVNVLARQVGARVIVVDMGVAGDLENNPELLSRKVAPGTRNMAVGPAMAPEMAVTAVEQGIKVVNDEIAKGLDIVGTGDMGIANTTASSAICAVITGKPVSELTGRGTGLDEEQLGRKIMVIEKALAVNKPDPSRPLDVLAKVGGFEIGGLSGVMLGAAAQRIPVVIDGFISGAAALIAAALKPEVTDYMVAAHVSAESGHQCLLEYLGLKPLLDLGMRLGEGTGAALGIFLAETATKVLKEMATFGEAGVSERNAAKD